ncbi:MAG: 4-hydroxy-tetrahydrodipicolinate reductase [Polyangiaceae bacterium]
MTSARRLRLGIVGASGRMGRALVRIACDSDDLVVACAVGREEVGRDVGELAGQGTLGVAVVDDVFAIGRVGVDVVVDFSSASFTGAVVDAVVAAGVPLVSGTTGLDDVARVALDRAATRVAVLSEPNTSVGVLVLGDLLRRALALMGSDVDVEIVETHHKHKVDAPSGTAVRLLEIAETARADARRVHGREGRPGARKADEIGVFAVRGGDVIGDHTIHLLAEGERLELTHRATNRDVFAHGALRAARWIHGRPAGRYTLRDVVGG